MLIETLKFVEDHASRVFSDLQRLTITGFLLYVAAPRHAEDIYTKSFRLASDATFKAKSLLPDEAKSQAVVLLTTIVVLWVAYQGLVALHDTLLNLLQEVLPRVIFRVGLVNRRQNEINSIKNFCFKFFDRTMNRSDFEILINLYEERIFREVANSVELTGGYKAIYIKERIVLFVSALLWSGELKPLMDMSVLAVLTLYGYYNGQRRSRDTFALMLTQRAAWDLVGPRIDHVIKHIKIIEDDRVTPRWMLDFCLGPLYIDIFAGVLHYSLFDKIGQIRLRKAMRA